MAVKINLKGPDGNVFVLLGMAKSFQRQLEAAGINGGNRYLAKALKNFTSMKYGEIVALLEKSELFEFKGKDDEGKSEDEE